MLQGRWWKWVVEVMTGGGRCQEGRKGTVEAEAVMIIGEEEDVGRYGGMGEEKKSCPNDVLFVSSSAPENREITGMPLSFPRITNLPQIENSTEMDLYTQAFKALSYRSPFDDASSGQPSSSSAAVNAAAVVPPSTASTTTSITLPSGLAQLLSRHSDSRKRHKKSNSGSEFKSSKRSEKGRGASIWVETEEYFRELTAEDIGRLHQVSNFSFSTNEKYFLIPKVSSVEGEKDDKVRDDNVVDNGVNSVNLNGVEVKVEETVKEEDGQQYMDVDSVGGGGKGSSQVVPEDNLEVKGEENREGEKNINFSERGSCAFSGVEWLLGSRSKIYLTSERPSKKRKLLGGDAGLEKLLVACPVEGSPSLCDYCSLGDTGDQLNRLIACGSCGVAVHQRCYGVQEDVRDSWYCSWCKRKQIKEVPPNADRPCVLCPKQGGALKPTRKRGSESESEGSMEFAHLFCCQWMPEIYVENTRTMEPIMNIDGIKETRRKLVCNLCKDKCGACVRCSNGACRTSFHPICAREARHRMEIWGKLGYDEVELRAFCSKHSEVQNSSSSQRSGNDAMLVGADSSNVKNGPVALTIKPPKLRIGLRKVDKPTVGGETANAESNLDKYKDEVVHQEGLPGNSFKFQAGCGGAENLVDKEALVRDNREDINASDSLDFTMILKTLVERGKVDMKDVAMDTGVSVDSLASVLTDNHVSTDMHCKIVKWLKNHAYLGSLQKPLIVKIKSTKAETDVTDDSKALPVVDSDVVPVKSVPPRRRTKSNIRILQEDKVLTSSKEVTIDRVGVDEHRGCLSDGDAPNCLNRVSLDDSEKILGDLMTIQDIGTNNAPKSEEDPPKASGRGLENYQADTVTMSKRNSLSEADISKCTCSVSFRGIHDRKKCWYIHPLIHKKLMESETGVLLKSTSNESDGYRDGEVSILTASSSSGICCNHQSAASDFIAHLPGHILDQSVKERSMALLEFSPSDEVEGELIFYQHRLICNAVARKRFTDDLISKVVRSLPQDIDAARKQKWDAVSLNQYLYELREAKKQGRKERRHKEAQAVLAAATAAAAASSRISSLRKDTPEDSVYLEDPAKVSTFNGKPGYSVQNARAKETLSRSSVTRLSLEKTSDFFQLTSDSSRENPRTCDVCRRSETMLNAILVCSSCKVAVHLDCYRSVNNSTGPWYCELCEDLLSARAPGASAVNSWERPYFVPECGLCGGTAGAFRKSTNGHWVHAFCAEWVLESTFIRGQTNPIEGMETISKGNDLCVVCRRKHGVCLKCHYGHCQSTFHPSCGRSAGFYMIVRTSGGRLQHKAYCEKHSLEQRAKQAENQRHGVEELKSLKQVRVELERLRLLCERIIKREKLKRELVICSQHILASKRDSVVLSSRSRHPFFQPDISSESVTTSVKAYPDGCKSGSEVMQRSDDITVDSTVAGKRHIEFPVSMDNDQKTDASSMSQHPLMQKPSERLSFAGKQIPHRPASATSRSTSDDREKRSKFRTHTETFEKELVMTSDQASMKNQRLPKGYVYVPIRCLSKEKDAVPDACSGEPMQRDG